MAPKAKSFANKGKAPAAPAMRKRDGDDDKTGKRRNREVLQFFEDEAGIEDDDDGFLSDDSLFDEIDDFPMEEECDPDLKVKKDSLKQQNTSFVPKEEEMDEDEFDRMMEERYRSHLGFKYVGDDEARSLKERDSLLSSGDSTIWKIKCMVGREKLLTFCLMQKFVDLKSLGNKLEIISVFAIDHIKGFIFIEAEKESSLVEACRGIAGIYYTRVAPVNRNDLPQLLSVRNKSNSIAKGMWVRVKSGNYKGDLGQVVAVNNSRKKATVKLIPRIDLQALTEKYGGGVARRKKTAVPAPRLISSSELEEFRPLIQYRRDRDTDKTFEILDGMMLKDGFLYKKVSLESLSYWGITPSEEELLKFKSSENKDSDDLEWLTQLYGGPRKKRTLGNGKGPEKGESSSGMEKGERSSGLEKGESSGSGIRNKFEMFELVCFGRKDYGLIVGMEKDGSYKILKDGPDAPMVAFVKERELKNGPSDMRFTASDQQGKTISANDTVKVLEGSLKDRQGIIKQIYRGTVFIYDENEVENGGYLCFKAQFCEKMKLAFDMNREKGGGSGAFDFEDSPSSPKSPLPPQTQWQSKDTNHDFKEGGKDEIFSIGQTLRIRAGPLKGHLCRVLAIRYSDVTVKLDSKHKILLVKSEHLSEVRGKNSTLHTSEDLGSSPFKAFDLLGAEGNSGDWAGGAGASRDSGEWNAGGVSAERTSWPAFPGSSSVLCSESGTANPLGSVDNGLKTDSESAWNNVVPSQKSSWGASATDDKAVGSGVQDGTWGQNGDVWNTASKEVTSDPCSSWDVPAAAGGNQEDSSKKISSWGVSSTDYNAATDGSQVHSWGKSGEGWNTAAKEVTSNQTSSWGAPVVNTASKEVSLDPCSSWDVPATGDGNQVGGWGKKSDNGWKKAAQEDGSKKISSWGAPSTDNNAATDGKGWNTAAKEVISNQTSSWGVPAAVNEDQGGKASWDNHEGGSTWGKLDGESAVSKTSATSSSWGKQGGQSSWSNKGEDSTWNKRVEESSFAKQGEESTWGKQDGGSSWNKEGGESSLSKQQEGGSSWNKQGGESSWSKQQEGGSSWKKQGGESSWSKQQEGGSSWNKQGIKENVGWKGGESSWSKREGGSSWSKQADKENVGWNKRSSESSEAKPGGESTWSKPEGGSSWNKQGGESTWGKQDGGGSSWNNQDGKENLGWNKKGGESSWGKQGGESTWGKQEGGSSWNKQGADDGGGSKSSSDGTGGSFVRGRGGSGEGGWRGRGRGEGGWRGRGRGRGEGGWRGSNGGEGGEGRGEGGWRGRGRGEGGWRGSGGGRGEGGWRGRGGGGRGDGGGWRSGGRASWSGGEDTGNSGGGQGSWSEKQENSSWSKRGDSSWGKVSGDTSWGKQGGDTGGSSGQGSWAEKQENSSWNKQGCVSSWGKPSGDSSWGKQGGDSSWGKVSGDSSWGKQGGDTGGSSGQGSWAEKQENSSWNKQGCVSSWGKSSGDSSWGKQGGDSSWGKVSGDSSWGKQGGDTGGSSGQGSWAEEQENSSWNKQGCVSTLGKPSGDSSWGKQGGDSGGSKGQGSWADKQGNSSWGKQEESKKDVESSWKAREDSSFGQQGGDSSLGKKAAGDSSWGKPKNDSGGGWKTGDGFSNSGSTGSKWGEEKPDGQSPMGNSGWEKEPAVGQNLVGGWSTGDKRKNAEEPVCEGSRDNASAKWGDPDGSSGGKTGWNSLTTDERRNPSAGGDESKTDDAWNKPEDNGKGSGGWN